MYHCGGFINFWGGSALLTNIRGSKLLGDNKPSEYISIDWGNMLPSW
jgi:hypothetical protein